MFGLVSMYHINIIFLQASDTQWQRHCLTCNFLSSPQHRTSHYLFIWSLWFPSSLLPTTTHTARDNRAGLLQWSHCRAWLSRVSLSPGPSQNQFLAWLQRTKQPIWSSPQENVDVADPGQSVSSFPHSQLHRTQWKRTERTSGEGNEH